MALTDHRIIWPDGGFWVDATHTAEGLSAIYAYCQTCQKMVRIISSKKEEPKMPTSGGNGYFIQTTHEWGNSIGRAGLMGRHEDHCLCHTPCKKFKPGEPDNCHIAEALLNLDKNFHLVTPVYECPEFEI